MTFSLLHLRVTERVLQLAFFSSLAYSYDAFGRVSKKLFGCVPSVIAITTCISNKRALWTQWQIAMSTF